MGKSTAGFFTIVYVALFLMLIRPGAHGNTGTRGAAWLLLGAIIGIWILRSELARRSTTRGEIILVATGVGLGIPPLIVMMMLYG